MDKKDLAAAMAAFQAEGGEITQVAEGEKSSLIDPQLRFCKCGCEGNYTDHSMRLGEGSFADQ